MKKTLHLTLSFSILIFAFSIGLQHLHAATISRPMHNSGLVGYWNFEEGKGSDKAYDRSGRGNTGTLTAMNNSTAWTSSKSGLGQALEFDGSDDYFVSPTNFNLNGSSGVTETVSLWFKTSSTGVILFNQTDNTDPNSAPSSWLPTLIIKTDGTLRGEFWTGSVGQIASSNNVADGSWHHAVMVGNNSTQALYLDGAVVGTRSGTIDQSWWVKTIIGTGYNAIEDRTGSGGTGWEYANSLFDDVRIYNRALSADEVARLYKIQQPKVASGLNNTGLVGYWAFEEGVGTRAEDSSFNNNTGSINGSTWTGGKNGRALSFDGNDFVSIEDTTSLRPNNVTISAWFYYAYPPSSFHTIVSKAYNGPPWSDPYISWLVRFNGPNVLEVDVGNGTSYSANPINISTPSVNAWHHVLVTYNGTSLKTYLDNVLIDTNTNISGNLGYGNTPVIIGADGGSSPAGDYFEGQIDEVRIYDRAFSASEVSALYNGSKATVVNKTNKTNLRNGLVGHWTFDGKDIYGTTALDSSGNNNRGTLTSGPNVALGKIGQALNFDGSDDYIDAGTSNSLHSATGFTYSAWVNADAFTGGNTADFPVVMSIYREAVVNDSETFLGFHSSGYLAGYVYDAEGDYISRNTGSTLVSPGQWAHVVMTWDGSSSATGIKLYINGVQRDDTTANGGAGFGSIKDSAEPLRIGVGNPGDTNKYHFDGKIEDVRIYNRAMSTDEVKALYNGGK